MPAPDTAPTTVATDRHARLSLAGLLTLTVSTGVIDAVSYLALDHVFTGNMTGNFLFVGFALVGTGAIPLVNNLAAILGFGLGAVVGTRVVGHGARHFTHRSSVLLLTAGALLAALVVVWAVVGELEGAALVVFTAILAMVMGVQVAAVKPIGNTDVTTIVVTNTYVNVVRDSPLSGGTGSRWFPRTAAIVAMCLGATIGALLVHHVNGWTALAAGLVVFLAGAALLWLTHPPREAVVAH